MDSDGGKGARILIACHRAGPVPHGPHLLPIHVGRAGSAAPLLGMIGDDTGDEISALNPEYCELTAHYWAWKNLGGTGPVGLMHYRRLFDLTGEARGPAERFAPDFDMAAWQAAGNDVNTTVEVWPPTAAAGKEDAVVGWGRAALGL